VEEFDPEEYFDTPKEFLTRAYNRPTREALKSNHVVSNAEHVSNQDLKKIKKETEKSYVELAARMNREKKIEQELDRAQLKKHLTVREHFCFFFLFHRLLLFCTYQEERAARRCRDEEKEGWSTASLQVAKNSPALTCEALHVN
jgi:hypothetical protein